MVAIFKWMTFEIIVSPYRLNYGNVQLHAEFD